jgi:hypothetical protein
MQNRVRQISRGNKEARGKDEGREGFDESNRGSKSASSRRSDIEEVRFFLPGFHPFPQCSCIRDPQ